MLNLHALAHGRTKAELSGSILGFDYGLARIGVAVGQTISDTASPLCVLRNQDGQVDWKDISLLIQEWQPVGLVVGLPLRLNGDEQAFTQNARKFAQRLGGRYNLPVFLIEEQLSSIAAEQRLQVTDKTAKKSRNNRDMLLDAHAAQILLSNWLETA
ncbi:Holliday junction resolvase RuvX [Thiomicrospira cyclica]|uniref:Putative pre-16S rRNA nuclease n=1 Tax=Thiomicrospira cyclica (strain DSM 14477 / JCM 11371 / ALM1) TaxID=717773 RepID=F6DAD2_THICA|nr:Holliday junction resolvase RuvX [Thiomicrospira cyclica]AEG31098.1 Holliday junction resolvase [Thiomicrospira cyclica ALM1]